jgi:hypothetical protein
MSVNKFYTLPPIIIFHSKAMVRHEPQQNIYAQNDRVSDSYHVRKTEFYDDAKKERIKTKYGFYDFAQNDRVSDSCCASEKGLPF